MRSGVGVGGVTVSTSTGGYSTTTNANGSYSLQSVLAGAYSVTASGVGYIPQAVSGVVVSAEQTVTCSFDLSTTINLARDAVTYVECGHANSAVIGFYGRDGNSTGTKWCCDYNSGTAGEHALAYDLGRTASVYHVVVRNVSLLGEPAGSVGTWDTKAFSIQTAKA